MYKLLLTFENVPCVFFFSIATFKGTILWNSLVPKLYALVQFIYNFKEWKFIVSVTSICYKIYVAVFFIANASPCLKYVHLILPSEHASIIINVLQNNERSFFFRIFLHKIFRTGMLE